MSDRARIQVVGSGPVGSLLSIYLARRGYRIRVYERRPDMRKEKISAGRSINLAISVRGLHALGEVGLRERALQIAIPMKGRMVHPVRGQLSFQPYGKDDSECIYSISRGDLNQLLMSEAEATGQVEICFGEKAAEVDLERGRVIYRSEEFGRESRIETDVVFGTDGSHSAVRAELMKSTSTASTESTLEHGYKELILPAGPKGSFQLEKNALHIWPRVSFMLIALPNFDGSFTCTLFLAREGPVSFATLDTPERVRAFFQEQFPDALELLPGLEEEFFAHPTGSMVTVKCTPWSLGGRALLLGDAAHAIVPFFGQGMNCGFEDCSVLNELIEEDEGSPSWSSIFSKFYQLRKENADAIADMALENFVEMRDKVGDPAFQREKQVERVLQKEMPGEYVSRYQLVTFSRVPYVMALKAGRVQNEILSILCNKISDSGEIDLAQAKTLVRNRLLPLLNVSSP